MVENKGTTSQRISDGRWVVLAYCRSEYQGLVYVVRDNDGDTYLEKVAGATSFKFQSLERISCTTPKQGVANVRGLMQSSTPNPGLRW